MHEQINLFSDNNGDYVLPNKKIRLIELFSGIGAQAKALEFLKELKIVDFESWRTCDWSIKSNQQYCLIHKTMTKDLQEN